MDPFFVGFIFNGNRKISTVTDILKSFDQFFPILYIIYLEGIVISIEAQSDNYLTTTQSIAYLACFLT